MKASTEQDNGERLKTKLAEYIKSKKMRQTPERFAILDKALAMRSHFDVDSLYNEIDAEYHVSRQTVYNTVELLCECQILRKHQFDNIHTVYELADSSHIHLICNKCGAIKEVSDETYQQYFDEKKFRGFHPISYSTYVYGICSSCSRKLKNAQKKSSKNK